VTHDLAVWSIATARPRSEGRRAVPSLIRTAMARSGLIGAPAHVRRAASGRWVVAESGGGVADLSISTACAEGIAICAIAHGMVGVDVESIDIIDATSATCMARTYFAARELAWILDGPDALSPQDRFFFLWTLKEAFAKALGTGIGEVLASTAFDIRTNGTVAVSTSLAPYRRWAFVTFVPVCGCRAAVAISL